MTQKSETDGALDLTEGERLSMDAIHATFGGEDPEIKGRDRVRKIVHAAAQRIIDHVLDTPPDRQVSVDQILCVFKSEVREPIHEFRADTRALYHERLAQNQGRLEEQPDAAD